MRDLLLDAPVIDLVDLRTRAKELVSGWMDGSSLTRPPADILRLETLGADSDPGLCFCAGTFCWPSGAPDTLPE